MNDGRRRHLEALGLERDPFPISEVLADIFTQGGRDRFLDSLSDTEGLGRPLIAVLGVTGVGKTAFFHALLRRLPERVRVARLTAASYLTAAGVLQGIARALDIPVDAETDHETLRDRLHAHLGALVDTGTTCVVMVDDAGDLEPSALEELVRIAELRPSAERIRVMLFSTPELPQALAQAAGARRAAALTHEILLEPYTLNELRAYLQFRLSRAGLTGRSPFREADFQRIYRRSEGIPGRANLIAAQVLYSQPWWRRRGPLLAACGSAGVAIGLLLLVLLGRPASDGSEPRAQRSIALPPPRALPAEGAAAPASERGVVDRRGSGSGSGSGTGTGAGAEGPSEGDGAEASTPVSPAQAPGLADDASPVAVDGTVTAPARSRIRLPVVAGADSGPVEALAPTAATASASASASASEAVLVDLVDGETTASIGGGNDEGAEAPVAEAPVAEVPVAEAPLAEGEAREASAEGAASVAAVDAPASAAPGSAMASADPMRAGGSQNAAETPSGALPPLRARDPGRYVLQLHVLSSEARARAWIAARPDAGRYRYFERPRGDTRQFVIVAGDYPDSAAALADAGATATRTGAQSPWARPVSALIAEMQAGE